MKQRVVAVVAALVLVGLAIVVRQAVVGGDGKGASSTTEPKATGLPRVACTPDLERVCKQLVAAKLARTVPPLDLDGASTPPGDVDAWITWDPGPRVADDADRQDAVWERARPIAHGPLAVAGPSGVRDEACPSGLTWACLAKAPDQGVSVGVGDPTTAESLARLAPIVRAVNDGDIDALATKVQPIVDSPQLGQGDARSMADQLVTPGALDLLVGPRAVLADAASSSQGKSMELQVRTPKGGGDATVVVAGRSGRPGLDAAAACRAAAPTLAELGASTCGGHLLTDKVAGLLYQVHERVQ